MIPRSSAETYHLAVVIGVVFLLGCLATGFRKHAGYMPKGATCSAVLSAACHPFPEEKDSAKLPVQWGVAPLVMWRPGPKEQGGAGQQDGQTVAKSSKRENVYGHCCFTASDVEMPSEHKLYN
jgi:hypothetical protein